MKSKNVRRTIALMLCLIMMMSVASFAVGEVSNELLPLSVVQFFAEQGYDISRTARMELVPVNMSVLQGQQLSRESNTIQDSGYAIRIIEQNGNEGIIYEATILSSDAGETLKTINTEAVIAMSNGNPTGSQVMPVGNIVVSASGSYQTYLKQGVAYLYQIQTLTWSYSKNSSCTVNSATVRYGAGGTAYSLPSLTLTHYGYSHEITSSVTSPIEGRSYFNNTSPCPYAIDIAVSSSPGSGGGMYFSCDVYIDGVRYTWH